VPAAVDAQRFAGDEIAVEERAYALRDLHLAAPPPERRRLFDRRRFLGTRTRRREDRSRRDCIDENVVGGKFQREPFGERDDAGLRDVVRQIAGVPRAAAPRNPVAEVDDAAAALRAHMRRRRVRAEERGAQVHVHHRVPVDDGQIRERPPRVH
jgi:hypothetical protein